jgi:hypothetical protein
MYFGGKISECRCQFDYSKPTKTHQLKSAAKGTVGAEVDPNVDEKTRREFESYQYNAQFAGNIGESPQNRTKYCVLILRFRCKGDRNIWRGESNKYEFSFWQWGSQ